MDQAQAIVVGASGAIGGAFADALEGRGAGQVARLSRHGPITLDLADGQSIADAVAAIGPLDQVSHVLVATGILHDTANSPEKTMRNFDHNWFARQFAVNATGPALLLGLLLPQLSRKLPVRVGVLSARVGSISDNRLGGWYGYRASKAALNQLIRTMAIEWARTHPQAVLAALHPGTVSSALSAPFTQRTDAASIGKPADRAGQLLDVLDSLQPSQSGRFFDYAGREIMP